MLYTKEQTRIEDNYRIYTGLYHQGKCQYCGDDFKSSYPLAKYCSQRCKNDAMMERRKIRLQEQRKKICAVCGKHFDAKKKDAMYCSNACKQKAYRDKKSTENLP